VRERDNYAVGQGCAARDGGQGIALTAFARSRSDDSKNRSFARPIRRCGEGRALLAEGRVGRRGATESGTKAASVESSERDRLWGRPGAGRSSSNQRSRGSGIEVKIKDPGADAWYEDKTIAARPTAPVCSSGRSTRRAVRAVPFLRWRRQLQLVLREERKLDKMLEQGRRELDTAKRRALYLATRKKLAVDDAGLCRSSTISRCGVPRERAGREV